MGGALQRREILIIGLILLIAGVAGMVLAFRRPPSPATYIQATPQPIATPGPSTAGATWPTVITVQPTAAVPPQPTAAPSESAAPASSALPTIQRVLPSPDHWPQLLFAAAAIGAVLTIRRWRRHGSTLKMPRLRLPRPTPPMARGASFTFQTLSAPAASPPLVTDPPSAPKAEPDAPAASEAAALIEPVRLAEGITPGALTSAEAVAMVELADLEAPAEPTPAAAMVAVEPIEAVAPTGPAEPSKETIGATASDIAPVGNTPRSLGIVEEEPPEPAAVAIQAILAAQTVDLGAARPAEVRDTAPAAPSVWTAEDRALASAAALATIWRAEGLSSPVRSLDTTKADGTHAVLINIDIHPDEEAEILNLPQILSARYPKWRASWRQEALTIEMPIDCPPPPAGGPLIAPILDHGRGLKTARFYPLATWRHLGIYGAQALHALHALLSSLLYTQPPSDLALAILDQGEITPLYRDVPHLITPPGDTHATLETIASALRRSNARTATRPLVLVLVEPNSAALARLHVLLMRLRLQSDAPLHIIITQTQLHSAGREVYALLPALITAGGQGPASWLPGQGEWPKSGAARLTGRAMRVEGRPRILDEAAVAAALSTMRRPRLDDSPAVLWDAPTMTSQETPELDAPGTTDCET